MLTNSQEEQKPAGKQAQSKPLEAVAMQLSKNKSDSTPKKAKAKKGVYALINIPISRHFTLPPHMANEFLTLLDSSSAKHTKPSSVSSLSMQLEHQILPKMKSKHATGKCKRLPRSFFWITQLTQYVLLFQVGISTVKYEKDENDDDANDDDGELLFRSTPKKLTNKKFN